MIPAPLFTRCRDRVLAIARAVLAEDVVGDPAPELSVGGIASKPAFEAIVREVPTNVDFQKAATCPLYDVGFDVGLDFVAKGRDLVEVSDLVARWCEAVMQGVLLDETLGGLCFVAEPRYQDSGTGVDPASRLYIAAITAAVHVKAHYRPSPEAVDAIAKIRDQEV